MIFTKEESIGTLNLTVQIVASKGLPPDFYYIIGFSDPDKPQTLTITADEILFLRRLLNRPHAMLEMLLDKMDNRTQIED